MTEQPTDTAATEIWARMLNAADIHVYGPEHQTWQRLTPKLQEQYREAARWLIPRLTVQPQHATGQHWPPCVDGDHCGEAAHCPPPANGIRDAARQASGQPVCACHPHGYAGECPSPPNGRCCKVAPADPTIADDPVQLRWGLGDVLHSDDDSRIVCLSGPNRAPYWLELDPERAQALRDDLAEPSTPAAGLSDTQPTVDRAADQSAEETPGRLAHVGWWCWRGNDHGHLADTACRSDNVPIHAPTEWATEMRAVIEHLTDTHEPGEDCTWVTPEEQAAESLAAADVEEDETR